MAVVTVHGMVEAGKLKRRKNLVETKRDEWDLHFFFFVFWSGYARIKSQLETRSLFIFSPVTTKVSVGFGEVTFYMLIYAKHEPPILFIWLCAKKDKHVPVH